MLMTRTSDSFTMDEGRSPSFCADRILSPEEFALQSICKSVFKTRVFRGFYEQRCHVYSLNSYRDVVALHRDEFDLSKLLLNITNELKVLYQQRVPNMWVGVTDGPFQSYKAVKCSDKLNTCIWTELTDVPFGEYWFTIISIRFHNQEVIFNLKMVRAIEMSCSPNVKRSSMNANTICVADSTTLSTIPKTPAECAEQTNQEISEANISKKEEIQVGFEKFVELFRNWGASIKYEFYHFLATEVNKANIIATLKFIGLLAVFMLLSAIYALKNLGIFTLRLLYEISRFMHVSQPMIAKLIDVVAKIIGGIFILITMIWRDIFGKQAKPYEQRRAIYYERRY